ncbi:class I SAM-dependent methyltransferase [Microbacteriaceae bacterium VKM Ac-2855]|nr:class I SAM-dependent methyltransferase [Microbacteriaceae bacterium VKM Ac-2855]
MVQVDRGAHLTAGEWLDVNRALWEERASSSIAGAPVARIPDGARVLYVQCGTGSAALDLAAAGSDVVGLDFSMPAVRRARADAVERDLVDRTRFLCANVYEARHMLPEPDSFDVVLTRWSSLSWLPDMQEWARIVEWYLAPNGMVQCVDVNADAPVERSGFRWTHTPAEVAAALEATGLRGDGSFATAIMAGKPGR